MMSTQAVVEESYHQVAVKQHIYIAILAILGIVFHLIFRWTPSLATYSLTPLLIVLVLGGIPLTWNLLQRLFHLDFGSDFLAGISIITAVLLGEYLAGALVILMLSGGEALEEYAIRSASRVLEALANRMATEAHCKRGDRVVDIPIEQIAIGDLILIFPHEICPVDGKVIEGHSVMDESYLTGEPFLISKAPGSGVISGAINGEGFLKIEASKLAIDSRYAKIMQVMRESEQKRPHLRRLADQLGAWYTPLALVIAIVAWIASGDPIRFLSVMVIATPCPLLIAIPVAIIGAISLCARHGVLIKNPVVLEQFDQCQTMILDKTGTLTYGKPTLTEQLFFGGLSPEKILRLSASVEVYSKHPLASAILQAAEEKGIKLVEVSEISEPSGKGLKGVVEGHEVWLTSRNQLIKQGMEEIANSLPVKVGLECVVLIDQQVAAIYYFRDAPRKESRFFVDHLIPQHGFKKLMIVSGDREEEVSYLAKQVGITEIYANQTPEEKVEIVRQEMLNAKTAFLGDGINDAPALTVATVGIAFGQNSDITTEAAGAVIMDNSLKRVDEFLHISKRMRRIALQSAVGGMLLSIVGMIVASLGHLTPVMGAISQEIIDVIAILNSLRVAFPLDHELSDFSSSWKAKY